MSDQTITLITILLFIFVLSAFIWPFALGIHLELEGRKKRNEPPQYDERQKLARQRAGNHALYVLLGFLALWAVVDQLGWFGWTGSVLDMVLCAMMTAWCVWASDCILNDAFVTWKNKQTGPSGPAVTYATLMIVWTHNFRSGMEVVDSWAPFVFACGNLAVLSIVAVYKYRRDKKAAQEEDAP